MTVIYSCRTIYICSACLEALGRPTDAMDQPFECRYHRHMAVPVQVHRYHYLLRPGGIACQPEGFIARNSDLPSRNRRLASGEWHYTFGYVDYLDPLTFEQVWKKDLLPNDPGELAGYRAWLDTYDRKD